MDLLSVYIPPTIPIKVSEIDFLFNLVQKPFIIGGDLNAHAIEWGCLNENRRALEKNDAVFLNDGSFTRLQPFPR